MVALVVVGADDGFSHNRQMYVDTNLVVLRDWLAGVLFSIVLEVRHVMASDAGVQVDE